MKIIAEQLPVLTAKIEAFNKKATKWSLPLITVNELSRYVESHKSNFNDEDLHGAEAEMIHIEYVEVEIVGEIPRIAGWSLHSRVEPTEIKGTNLVFTAPHFAPEERLRSTGMICEHCNHKRARSLVVLLQHEDGTQKIVGKTCLKDFLPTATIENLLAYANFFIEVSGDDEEYHRVSRHAYVYEVKLAIAEALVLIGKNGYTSKKASNDYHSATSAIMGITGKDRPKFYTDAEIAAVSDKVDAVVEYVNAQNGAGNDFIYNLQTSIKLEYVKPKMFGYIAAAANMYLKSIEEAAAIKNASNEYLGTVGTRVDFTNLKITRVNVSQGDFGNTYIYGFEDEIGNCVVWFASKDIGDVNDVVSFKGTIKAHNEYKGRKQTVVTRCKLI